MSGHNLPKVAAWLSAQSAPHPILFCTSLFHKNSIFTQRVNEVLTMSAVSLTYCMKLLNFKARAIFMCREQNDAFSFPTHQPLTLWRNH